MKKAISKINPFRYTKKLHIGYIWLIAVLLLLVVGVICSGAKVYKYSPILSVVSYSLAAISLIAIIIMIVRKISDMKIQSELDKYILVLNEHKDDQEWLHKELTYVNLRIYNKTNGHLYRCKKKMLEEYKNEVGNESVAKELMVPPLLEIFSIFSKTDVSDLQPDNTHNKTIIKYLIILYFR